MAEYLALCNGWTLRVQCPRCRRYASEIEWIHSLQCCTRCADRSGRSERREVPPRATHENGCDTNRHETRGGTVSPLCTPPINTSPEAAPTRAYAPARGEPPTSPQPALIPTQHRPNVGATRGRVARAGGSKISPSILDARSPMANVRRARERGEHVLRPAVHPDRLRHQTTRGRHDDTTTGTD